MFTETIRSAMSAHMFREAHNFTITGGQFTVISSDESTKIHNWLKAPNCSANHVAAADKKTPGTGQWILDHPEYQKWKSHPSILWIQGKAGSGKTVLSTTILKDLRSNMDTDAIWYHYFDIRNNTGKKSNYRGFLLSLVLQLGLDHKGINLALLKLYKKLKGYEDPQTEELQEVIKTIIIQRNGGYLLVDAMDECTEGTEKVMDWLCQFASKLWIVVTSRHSADSKIEQSALKIMLDNEKSHTQVDMETYIKSKILSAEYNFDLNETYWEYVVEMLKKGSTGQFRWAECQLKEVKECNDVNTVEKVLENLPKDLEEIYLKAVQKAKEGRHSQDAHHLLLWLLYAYEPLNQNQVEEILKINVKEQIIKNKGMRTRLHTILDSSLIVIGGNKVVQFAHASVKEFLFHYHTLTQVKNMFEMNEMLANDMIAQACIIYILHVANRGENNDVQKEFILWKYACRYWPVHARSAGGKQKDGPLESLTQDILTDLGKGFLMWRKEYESKKWHFERENISTALYYAAKNRLIKRVKDIIMEKRRAISENNKSILEVQIYINLQCGAVGNALQAAVWQDSPQRYPQVQQNKNTAGVNLQDITAAVVKVLIENGANVNAQGGEYGNALQGAAQSGNEGVVKLLLENGADVSVQGGQYGNALQGAAQSGNEAVVKLLLENGADM
ncbi:hypothetical protein GYMLUDRAFT_829797 [Collybiopsis luxurians FD-317 M1]|uniref:NACHT domain-containing protein n=1 Tax=Collybiopsis luxurians FD-317 M1 TaxID=944289 RepID=A0A0D0CDD1_9AGAR|nr:hypothetical protein GYMLUDRAFT_829797 [Collybiopsis luxurians FD-317 M1]